MVHKKDVIIGISIFVLISLVVCGSYYVGGGSNMQTALNGVTNEKPVQGTIIEYSQLTENQKTELRQAQGKDFLTTSRFLSEETVNADYIHLDGKYYLVSREKAAFVTGDGPVEFTSTLILFFAYLGGTFFGLIAGLALIVLSIKKLPAVTIKVTSLNGKFTLPQRIYESYIEKRNSKFPILTTLLVAILAVSTILYLYPPTTMQVVEVTENPVSNPIDEDAKIYSYANLDDLRQQSFDESVSTSREKSIQQSTFSELYSSENAIRFEVIPENTYIKSDGEYFYVRKTTDVSHATRITIGMMSGVFMFFLGLFSTFVGTDEDDESDKSDSTPPSPPRPASTTE